MIDDDAWSDPAGEELELLSRRADAEKNPQAKAVLWAECLEHVLSLEDIREGLTFDEIKAMSDSDANRLSDRIKAVLGFQEPLGNLNMEKKIDESSTTPLRESASEEGKGKREQWPKDVAKNILTKCHHRCCICPEHRRVANIHHIDEDPSNSVEVNGVGLCGECHPDVHTKSTIRRNITPEQIHAYKASWEKKCSSLANYLQAHAKEFSNSYYLNFARLDPLFYELQGQSLYTSLPHRYPSQEGFYNTLWPHPKNSLDYISLAENRNYFEGCLRQILPKLVTCDLNLIELGAVPPTDIVGGLVSFTCQFIGKDIPDQNELIEGLGKYDGPFGTMRRETFNECSGEVLEICMMIDPLYMYSDSSFIHFSEAGRWNGLARATRLREAVGSNDGHLLRRQLVLTPIVIATPANFAFTSSVPANVSNPVAEYDRLMEAVTV